jgi:hypothetical protein
VLPQWDLTCQVPGLGLRHGRQSCVKKDDEGWHEDAALERPLWPLTNEDQADGLSGHFHPFDQEVPGDWSLKISVLLRLKPTERFEKDLQ